MTAGAKRRIAFTLHYDGAAFYGWQFQTDHPSVQASIEAVLGRLFDEPVRVAGAGRTDRGVHATGQVAMVNAPVRWEPAELRRAMNALLPDSVWVSHAACVDARFHPRFDAVARSYIYRVGTETIAESPFHGRWCWPLDFEIDPDRLVEAAPAIIGDHSFRAFAKAGQEHRGDRCIVESAEWQPVPGLGIEFRITANRFLHHMVRYLVGTMLDIGAQRRPVDDLVRMLGGADDVETSPPAPSKGLFLSGVRYPEGAYEAPLDTNIPVTMPGTLNDRD